MLVTVIYVRYVRCVCSASVFLCVYIRKSRIFWVYTNRIRGLNQYHLRTSTQPGSLQDTHPPPVVLIML